MLLHSSLINTLVFPFLLFSFSVSQLLPMPLGLTLCWNCSPRLVVSHRDSIDVSLVGGYGWSLECCRPGSKESSRSGDEDYNLINCSSCQKSLSTIKNIHKVGPAFPQHTHAVWLLCPEMKTVVVSVAQHLFGLGSTCEMNLNEVCNVFTSLNTCFTISVSGS